jgi:hypothetical protein
MTYVSDHLIEAMGFHPNVESSELDATFFSLHVFEFHGINLPGDGAAKFEGEIAGVSYAAAIGVSINALSTMLASGEYVDEEAKWQSEKAARPPYLMVRFGPTSVHSAMPRHIMAQNQDLHTYDAFRPAIVEMQNLEATALPNIVTAAVVALTSPDRPHVRLRAVDRAFFGITTDGKTLHDIRLTLSASLTTSANISDGDLSTALESANSVASKTDAKVAKLFHLALGEDDPLKRFLYFFLSIEVQTHRTFKTIDHKKHIDMLSSHHNRIQITSTSFFGDAVRSWTNLKDRFIWCAHCVWTDLKQSDISEFARLKRIRDSIAHGDIAAPNTSDVTAIEKLAIRLQQQHTR